MSLSQHASGSKRTLSVNQGSDAQEPVWLSRDIPRTTQKRFDGGAASAELSAAVQ